MRRLVPILGVIAFLSGCAARKPAPAAPLAAAPTDVMPLIRRGCHQCLAEA
jgi:hypothetical protein